MADPTLESGRSSIQTVWSGYSVARRMGGAAIGLESDKGVSIPRIDHGVPAAAHILHPEQSVGLVYAETLVPPLGADSSSTNTNKPGTTSSTSAASFPVLEEQPAAVIQQADSPIISLPGFCQPGHSSGVSTLRILTSSDSGVAQLSPLQTGLIASNAVAPAPTLDGQTTDRRSSVSRPGSFIGQPGGVSGSLSMLTDSPACSDVSSRFAAPCTTSITSSHSIPVLGVGDA